MFGERTFKGIRIKHEGTGFTVSGAIDDLWYNPETEEYIVVDYKATAKAVPVVDLNEEWQDGYKRQMSMYKYLLEQYGLKVSNVGYFVYCTGNPNLAEFDNTLRFESNIIPCELDSSWVDEVIDNIKLCLDNDRVPGPGAECDYCTYRNAVGNIKINNVDK